jgi:hypothetical protein
MSPHAPTPDLVDALTGMPIYAYPETGQRYAIKPSRPHRWARALDAAIVITAAVILMITLQSQAVNFTLGREVSLALLSNGLLMFAAMTAVWFATIYLYGMICGSPVGGIGDQVFGVHGVRITDGTRSGALAGGWRAICWSLLPFALIFVIIGLFGDGGYIFIDLPWRDSRYVGVDTRSGLAQGMEPVPAPDSGSGKK